MLLLRDGSLFEELVKQCLLPKIQLMILLFMGHRIPLFIFNGNVHFYRFPSLIPDSACYTNFVIYLPTLEHKTFSFVQLKKNDHSFPWNRSSSAQINFSISRTIKLISSSSSSAVITMSSRISHCVSIFTVYSTAIKTVLLPRFTVKI